MTSNVSGNCPMWTPAMDLAAFFALFELPAVLEELLGGDWLTILECTAPQPRIDE